jgi:hypothetical protein
MGGIMEVVRAEFSSKLGENHHGMHQPRARELVDPMAAATHALEQARRQALR